MEKPEWEERRCDVCGRKFTKISWNSRHNFHKPACPNFIDFTKEPEKETSIVCDCDLVAHNECCPQCYPDSKLPDTLAAELRKLN